MADTTISALPAVGNLAPTALVPIVQDGVTSKAAVSQLLSLTAQLPALGTTAVATGNGVAMAASFSPQVQGLVNGSSFLVRAPAANSVVAPTIALGTTPAKAIVKGSNAPLQIADIGGANYWMELVYDSTLDKFQLLNPVCPAATYVDLQASSMNGGPLAGFRNKVINGDMRIDQRFQGAAVVPVPPNTYTLDKVFFASSQVGKYNFQQNANGASLPAGFTNYAGFVLGTPFTPAAADFLAYVHRIEGFDMQEFGWGTAAAKPITVSFWVRSAMAGNHSLSICNGVFDRSYPVLFSIPTANTWTFVAIPISGDTAGTWDKGANIGLNIYLGLGLGSNFEGTNAAWNAGNKLRAVGAVNPSSGTAADLFAVTGLQVEGGTIATPFERRPYGVELSLCQRYCWVLPSSSTIATGQCYSTTSANGTLRFPQPMRAIPTITYSSQTGFSASNAGGAATATTAVSVFSPTAASTEVSFTIASGLVAGNASLMRSTTGQIVISADL